MAQHVRCRECRGGVDTRQITGLAAGTADTDAVNVAQLKSLDSGVESIADRAVQYDGTVGSAKTTITLEGVTSTDGGVTGGVKIQNLGTGALSATSTDAVNGSQLFGTNTQVSNLGTSTATNLGGGAIYDSATGTVSAPSYTVQGSQYNNVGGAIGAVDGSLTTLSSNISSGSVGVVQRTGTTDETVLTAAGGSATSPGAAQKLTNLAAGTLSATSTDAVNGSQLFGTNTQVSNLGTSTATNLGGGAIYDSATGTVSAPSYTVQGSQYNNVGGAIGAVDGSLTTLSSNISSGSVGVVQRTGTTDETVLTAAGGSATSPGAAQKLTNLAAGTLSATSTDAVNGSQLFGVQSSVSSLQNGTDGMFQVNNNSSAAKPTATGADSVAGGAGAIASGSQSTALGPKATATGQNSVALGSGANASATNGVAIGADSTADRDNSVSVGSAGNERQITNVAAATQGTDAVNFDQLNKSVSALTEGANAYTDQRYSELRSDLKKQDDTLSAGIAGAMAMASLPQPYSAGASMTSLAAANYRGQSAISFGFSRVSDNGRWVTKLQANTNTKGDAGIAAGVGYQW